MPRTQPRVLRLAPAQCMSAITPKLPASCTSRRTRPAMVVYRHLLRGSPALVACCCLLTYAPPAPPARWRARLLRLLLGSGVGSGRGAQGSALAIRHQSRRSGRLLVPRPATWWWQAVVWRRLVGARRSAQLRRGSGRRCASAEPNRKLDRPYGSRGNRGKTPVATIATQKYTTPCTQPTRVQAPYE